MARASTESPHVARYDQPRMGIVSRGTGACISAEEKTSRHTDVDVRFQPKAWTDADYCLEEHAAKEVAEVTAEARALGQESVLFSDNLHGQTTDERERALVCETRAKYLLHCR